MDEHIPKSKGTNWTSVAIWGCIAGFFAVVIILAALGTNIGAELIKIVYGFKNAFGPEWGIYMIFLAVFLISIFGNMTVIFPVPYTIALSIITILPEFDMTPNLFNLNPNPFNIILLSIFAGLGAGLGEITAYLLGRGSAKTLEDTSYGQSLHGLKSKVEKGWAIPLMLLFAATPIPDDPLLLVLGIVGYSLTRMTIVYIFGKIFFCLYLSVIIRLAIANPGIASLLNPFGINLDTIRRYDYFGIWIEAGNPIISAITWIAVLVLIILLIFVDWKAQFQKIRNLKKKE
ncbi:MAG: hypothetical protein ACFFCM_06385 [Promethearchaeota archaeon]